MACPHLQKAAPRPSGKAEARILGCEACSEGAEIPFENAAKCPRCRREINEKTLVETYFQGDGVWASSGY